MAGRASAEKRRTASTAKGRASAPASWLAARAGARQSHGSAPSQMAAASRWSASTATALGSPRLDGGGVARPGQGGGRRDSKRERPRRGTPPSRPAEFSRCRRTTRAARSSSSPWRTSQTVPNRVRARTPTHAAGSRAAPGRPVACAGLPREDGDPGDQHEAGQPPRPAQHRSRPRRVRSVDRSARPAAARGSRRRGAGTRPGAPSGPSKPRALTSGRAGRGSGAVAGETHHHDEQEQTRHQGEGGRGQRGRHERVPGLRAKARGVVGRRAGRVTGWRRAPAPGGERRARRHAVIIAAMTASAPRAAAL